MINPKFMTAFLLSVFLPLSIAFGQRPNDFGDPDPPSGRLAGQFSISGFGGAGLPMGPESLTDYYEMGIGFGGEIRYHLTDMTGLAVGFTLQPFKVNEEQFLSEWDDLLEDYTYEVEGGDFKVNTISVDLIRYFTSPTSGFGLYLTAGAGYYLIQVDDVTRKTLYQGELVFEETFEGGESESNFGLNGGIGVELTLGTNLFLFAEARYHYVFTEGDKTTFITGMGGIRFAP